MVTLTEIVSWLLFKSSPNRERSAQHRWAAQMRTSGTLIYVGHVTRSRPISLNIGT